MKKSEIKDLYNQSDEALRMLKAMVLLLPYAKGNTAISKAIAIAANLVAIVKTMCDYMIDDGSYDMTESLQAIMSEVRQIESNVAKMGYSEERVVLARNCRAIINNIKDVEKWTNNIVEPQPETIKAPQQANECEDGELTGKGTELQPEGKTEPQQPTNYIELPLGMQMQNSDRPERIFTKAVDKGWMETIDENTGNWIGFVKTKDGIIKSAKRTLAYLCHMIYGDNVPWGDIEAYFGETDLSKDWGNVKNYQNRQPWQNQIDILVNQ